MKIYFSGSRYYRDMYGEIYKRVVLQLKSQGYEVFDNSLERVPKGTLEMSEEQKHSSYMDIVKLLDRSDFSVFEASYPSTLHIGHEISLAIEKGKPIIVLYSQEAGKEPMLFRGIKTDKLIWVVYSQKNLEQVLRKAIEKAKKMQDVRFNFFASPKHLEYLDWVAKKKMIPRAVFLRDLIEKEIKKDKEYTKTD